MLFFFFASVILSVICFYFLFIFRKDPTETAQGRAGRHSTVDLTPSRPPDLTEPSRAGLCCLCPGSLMPRIRQGHCTHRATVGTGPLGPLGYCGYRGDWTTVPTGTTGPLYPPGHCGYWATVGTASLSCYSGLGYRQAGLPQYSSATAQLLPVPQLGRGP